MEQRKAKYAGPDAETLHQMQEKELELLRELDRVCKKNGLRYVLASGSCLGAVRHQGFIPWDDDVDVYMSWYDAERLTACSKDLGPV